jgi:hypothetical protein
MFAQYFEPDQVSVRITLVATMPDGVRREPFRRLLWVLPAGWPLVPLLYLPGIIVLGRRVYGWVAARRTTTSCPLHGTARG